MMERPACMETEILDGLDCLVAASDKDDEINVPED